MAAAGPVTRATHHDVSTLRINEEVSLAEATLEAWKNTSENCSHNRKCIMGILERIHKLPEDTKLSSFRDETGTIRELATLRFGKDGSITVDCLATSEPPTRQLPNTIAALMSSHTVTVDPFSPLVTFWCGDNGFTVSPCKDHDMLDGKYVFSPPEKGAPEEGEPSKRAKLRLPESTEAPPESESAAPSERTSATFSPRSPISPSELTKGYLKNNKWAARLAGQVP